MDISLLLQRWFLENRKALLWSLLAIFLLWVLIAVKEVTSLLFLAYGLALLLNPFITKLEKYKISRGGAIFSLGLLVLLVLISLLLFIIPALFQEYNRLVDALPTYIEHISQHTGTFFEKWFGVSAKEAVDKLRNELQGYTSALSIEQIKPVLKTVGSTFLQGYSFTLTILNLVLLPFFLFYIARDLHKIHAFLTSFFQENVANKLREIGSEILEHVHAFFRGQLTVSLIMAALYALGLSLVGLPYAVVVGVLSGILNLVPYLGITVGLTLATLISLVTNPGFIPLLWIWGVFVLVQTLEGTILTPKIVGESLGIHPLGVMLALLIGGQLFGLLGLILAIPAAAAFRVMFRHLLFDGTDGVQG